MAYSLEALRKARDPEAAAQETAAAVPLDAPVETDETIGFWNGHAFVSWQDYVWFQIKRSANSGNNSVPSSTTEIEPQITRRPAAPKRRRRR